MDIEFLIQDAFTTLRPQWEFLTTLEEAGNAFALACKDNYAMTNGDKTAANADLDRDEDVDEDRDDGGRRTPEVQDDGSSSDEGEVGENSQNMRCLLTLLQMKAEDANLSPDFQTDDEADDEDEHIVVTRHEDERDPEADAEFDRELAKMMAESVETRKTERRPMFDVAMPMRRAQRDTSLMVNDGDEGQPSATNTIKFSLLSKKGNRPQVCLFTTLPLACQIMPSILTCMIDSLH